MKFLILLIVLFWCVALLRRAISWMVGGLWGSAQPNSSVGQDEMRDVTAPRRLVRDPVCGVHVAEALAIPLREGEELIHFCSTACRDKYVAGEKKLAANG